jgi:thiol-disulfide isomerase/thioredoxin
MKRILMVILAVVLASGLLMTGCSSEPSEPSEPTNGGNENSAPDFELENLDGKSVSLSSFRGKPVMINFWATWCIPCAEEMPLLQELHDDWSSKGLVFLSIDVGEDATKASGYMQREGYDFPVLLDNRSEVAIKFGIQYLPTTLLIDRDGTLLAMKIGAFFNMAEIENDYLAQVFPELQE